MLRNISKYLIIMVCLTIFIGDSEVVSGKIDLESSVWNRRTIVYSDTPKLNKEVTIYLQGQGQFSENLIWKWVSFPKDANQSFYFLKDRRGISFVPNQTGRYKLRVQDTVGVFIETEFSVVSELPFDVSRLDTRDDNISDISSIVTNQFWVYSESLGESQLRKIVRKTNLVRIIGYDRIRGLLIECDTTKKAVAQYMHELESKEGVDSIDSRVYEGDDYINPPTITPNEIYPFENNIDNWHLEYIHMDQAWDMTTGNNDFTIGVCDSGNYDKNHEDLGGVFQEIVHSRNRVTNKEHGTMVSGVIGAVPNNHKGISGLNWKTKIVATMNNYRNLKSLSDKSSVKLINNSWGLNWKNFYDFDPNDAKKQKKRKIYAYKYTRDERKLCKAYPNKLFIWSTGNGVDRHRGYNTTTHGVDGVYAQPAMHYPSNGVLKKLDNVLTVSALRPDGRLTYYSNYGESTDIAAPTRIKSTKIHSKYGMFNGTSASAPIVTGVASLVYAVNPSFSASDVKKILIQSATSFVKERYINPNSRRTEQLKYEIPILDAQKAIEMAQRITAGNLEINHSTGKIKPVIRDIDFSLSPEVLELAWDDLSSYESMVIILANGIEIPASEYEKFKLDIDISGVNYDIVEDSEHRVHIKFVGESTWCLMSSREEISIKISVEKGALKNDTGTAVFHIVVRERPFAERCSYLFHNSVYIMLVIFYLFGIVYKGKFCRNQRISGIKKDHEDEIKILKQRLSNFVPWWQRFIPYRSERIRYRNITLISSRTCNAVYLPHKTKIGVIIDGFDIEDTGGNDIKVYSGSTIKVENEKYYLH